MSQSKTTLSWWVFLSSLGLNSIEPPSIRNYVALSNQLSLVLLPLGLGALSVSLLSHHVFLSINLLFASLVFIATLLFNYLQWQNIGRVGLANMPVGLFCLVTINGDVWVRELNSSLFFAYSFFTVLPILLFHFREEKKFWFSSLLVNFMAFGAVLWFSWSITQGVTGSGFSHFIVFAQEEFFYVATLATVFGIVQSRNMAYGNLQKSLDDLTIQNLQSRSEQEVLQTETQNLGLRNKILSEQAYVMISLAKSDFVQNGIIEGALEEVCRTVALTINVSRVSIWKIVDESSLCCSQVYSKVAHDLHTNKHVKSLQANSLVAAMENTDVADVFHDKNTELRGLFFQMGCLANSTASALISTYWLEGRMHGFVLIEEEDMPRKWTSEDNKLCKVASDILAISYSSYRLRSESETIKKQHDQIIQKNEFIEQQKESIEEKNKSLLESKNRLENSLQKLEETQQQLAKKESESRSILDSINDHNLVVEYDLKGDIIGMNERTRELTGISPKDLEGAYKYSIKSLLLRSNHFSHLEYDNFWSSLSRGVSRKYELKIILPGTELWVAATFLPIRNQKDEFIKILAIAHDISTVKSQQQYIEKQNEKLKEQRKEIIRINNSLEERVKERTEQLEKQNQQLLEYAFINAHLLRAPVCNILGLIDLLKNHDFDAEQMEIIQFLDNSTKELDEMVMKINRSIKKGYYDDPQLTEQIKNWNRKQNQQKKAG